MNGEPAEITITSMKINGVEYGPCEGDVQECLDFIADRAGQIAEYNRAIERTAWVMLGLIGVLLLWGIVAAGIILLG